MGNRNLNLATISNKKLLVLAHDLKHKASASVKETIAKCKKYGMSDSDKNILINFVNKERENTND